MSAAPTSDEDAPSVADRSLLARAITGAERIFGLARSIFIYYGQPLRHRQLVRFYSQFISEGDQCFDIGAHLGNRTRAWLALGARVVAVEPQPLCVRWLKRWYGARAEVELRSEAVGAQVGSATLLVSRRTPTVSTISRAWTEAVSRSAGFDHVEWQESLPVAVTTLDELIARHGLPTFTKIDVEGGELEALRGCSHALPALSFEYIPAVIERALDCIDRLQELGDYEYQWGAGERPHFQADRWLQSAAIKDALARLPQAAPAGDVYARLSARAQALH